MAAQVVQSAPACRNVRAISDVHTDFAANRDWIAALGKTRRHKEDALIVAGDVSHKAQLLEWTLRQLASAFNVVIATVGNHDLWLERGAPASQQNSLNKLQRIERICHELGVYTTPCFVPPLGCEDSVCSSSSSSSSNAIGDDVSRNCCKNTRGVYIIPLLSWHHEGFDKEPPLESIKVPPVRRVMADFKLCKWPKGLEQGSDELARYIDDLNDARFDEGALKEVTRGAPVITFSHFVPRQELIPEKRFLAYPELPKAAGSNFLNERIQRLQPDCHVYGHTHFGWDMALDGTRFVQLPLSYPAEREARMRTIEIAENPHAPPLLYSCETGHFIEQQSTFWSDYYREHARDPQGEYPLPEFLKEKWPPADAEAEAV